MSQVTVRDLQSYFGYRILCGDDSSLNRVISDANVNRPGLELSGYFDGPAYHRLILLGEKEIDYISKMTEEKQSIVFDFITSERIPAILIARDLPCPKILLDIAQKKNFPIFSSYAPTSSLFVEIISYLESFFAKRESYHGTLIKVNGHGVLISGESGVGKSEIALELVKKGHVLIADDRVDVCRLHNKIYGQAPEILKNMLEIRGVGIINVESMYGVMATDDESEVECIIQLEKWSAEKEFDRLGLMNQQTENFFGIDIPKLRVPVSEGRSIAPIIESVVANIILRQKGKDSFIEFQNRLTELIEKGE